MVGKNLLAAAMVIAAFAGGAVSNRLFQSNLTPADAQESLQGYLDMNMVRTPPTFRTPAEQYRFRTEPYIPPTLVNERTMSWQSDLPDLPALPTQTLAANAFHFVDERGKVHYTLTIMPDERDGQPRLAVLDEYGQVVWWVPNGRFNLAEINR